MRRAFRDSLNDVFSSNEELFLLLGDIGVFGFKDILKQHPERAINIGILEQSMMGIVAGLSKVGFIPVLHSIAPFLIERCYEQIKLVAGYHESNCRIVSIGASFDYVNLGPTHHCPADIAILSAIPNLQLVIPATASDFRKLFLSSLTLNGPMYFRLTDNSSDMDIDVEYGKLRLLNSTEDRSNIILSIGPMIDVAEDVANQLKLTHLNCTMLSPFDSNSLAGFIDDGGAIHIIEPYFEGSTFMSLSDLSAKYRFFFYGYSKSFKSTCGEQRDVMRENRLTSDLLIERLYERL